MAEQVDVDIETPEDLESCREALAAARKESDERWQALLRARAELDNLRKRSAREKADAYKYATGRLIEALLPVKDSLEMALDAPQASNDDDGLRQGVELTLNKLASVLADHGVETVDPEGEPFDPNRHEAIGVEPAAETPPDTVAKVHQKGYLLNGRLLRPAAVTVAQAAKPMSGEAEEAAAAAAD